MSYVALYVLILAMIATGRRFRKRLRESERLATYRLSIYGLTGSLFLYGVLFTLHALGIPWHRIAILLGLLVFAVTARLALWGIEKLGERRRRRRRAAAGLPPEPEAPGSKAPGCLAPLNALDGVFRAIEKRFGPEGGEPPRRPRRPLLDWADAVALLAVLALAYAALRGWSMHKDFIYHWGLKAHRYFLVGGLDGEFLSRPWNLDWIHPAYPHLTPMLYAASARLAGYFHEPALLLWSALAFAGMVAAVRQVLIWARMSRFGAQLTLVAFVLAVGSMGLGHRILGGPDWVMAWLPLAAWPAFQRPSRASDRTVGVIAAVAAVSKMEGIVLGGLLAAVYLLRREKDSRLQALPAVLAPMALVLVPWLVFGLHHGLFGHSYGGGFEPAWAGPVAAGIVDRLGRPQWHGLGWLLAGLPLLYLTRTSRWIALVITGQAAFYLYAYLAAPFETAEAVNAYVRSNFNRLAFHLLPTVLVGLGIGLDAWVRGAEKRELGKEEAKRPQVEVLPPLEESPPFEEPP